jgi:hypothetical protein
MSSKALTILTVLGLLCAPLAAQVTEDPMQQDPGYEEQSAPIPEDPAISDEPAQTDVSTEAEYESDLEADVQDDQAAFDDESTDELPRTASPFALLALLGGAGLATGFGLRLQRRK